LTAGIDGFSGCKRARAVERDEGAQAGQLLGTFQQRGDIGNAE
jgi:hypothetical protein